MKQKVTIEIIGFLLILLFVYAALSKLLEYTTFRIQLGNSPFLKPFAGIVSWLVPSIELAIALPITVKNTLKYGLLASLLLLSLFTFYVAGMLLSVASLPCGCGGIIRELGWGQHLVFNLFFVALNITGILFQGKQKSREVVSKPATRFYN